MCNVFLNVLVYPGHKNDSRFTTCPTSIDIGRYTGEPGNPRSIRVSGDVVRTSQNPGKCKYLHNYVCEPASARIDTVSVTLLRKTRVICSEAYACALYE